MLSFSQLCQVAVSEKLDKEGLYCKMYKNFWIIDELCRQRKRVFTGPLKDGGYLAT